MLCALKKYVFKEICNAFIYIVLTERVWLHVLLFFEIVHQWYLRNIFLKSLLSVDSLSCFEIISRTLIKNLFTNGFLELLSSAARGGRSLPREARLNGYTNMLYNAYIKRSVQMRFELAVLRANFFSALGAARLAPILLKKKVNTIIEDCCLSMFFVSMEMVDLEW